MFSTIRVGLVKQRYCVTLRRTSHWRKGRGLEADDDLAAIALAAGLDREAALTASGDPALLARVDEKQDEARRNGVRGIPTFVFEGERMVGCQPYEALYAAARRAGAEPRKGAKP